VGGEGIGQLHETASGGTGSVDTVMHELGAGGGDGNAAGQQVPAVADAAGAIEREENERLRRAAEAAGVAGGSSQADIYVMGAIMVRGSLQGNMRVRRYSHLQLHVAVPAYSQVTHSVRVMQLQLPALADFCKYRSGRYSQFTRSHTCSLLATQKVPSAILSYIT
jgi:hypothetical protein